ncbi:MAG: hypothetical protein GY950_24540, partial [bacterium]|nr:hypothetical protein [bacterium]
LTLRPDRDGLPATFSLKVQGNGRRFYLHKDKNFKEFPEPGLFFVFPAACPVPVEKSIPAWAAGYQVFPDRFFKSARQTPRDFFTGWGQPPGNYSYFGGDLPGITQKLPYLSRLGIHFLYLNPVFYSKTSHRYDTVDYYQIDPLLGSRSDLEELVREAHGWNIRIILDLPLNHCSVDFFAFKDILEKQLNSAYCDWFHIRRFPVEVKADHDYGSWQGNKDMPEFNLRNPAVRDYLLGATRYWLETAGIDGFRLDACSSLPQDFIRDFVNSVRDVKKEAVVVGEFWHTGGSRLFREGGVDGLTNFSFY